jgi:mannose-6-phosphate isomerase
MASPELLRPAFVEKIWGANVLEPWFRNVDRKVGEVCFPAEDILFKFIFTSERLSVQAHPNDEQARAAGLANGKTEMWHILRAGPDATLGLGFKEPVTRERMRESALSGEIEHLIDWKPVRAGETYFVEANTVHAIGPDLALCEVQQNSDTTYRLFDYGRPRELHLDDGVKVSRGGPHPGASAPAEIPGGQRLADCDYFITDLLELSAPAEYGPVEERYQLLAILKGNGSLAGEAYVPGQLWRVPLGARFRLEPAASTRVLRAFKPRK